ncbi:MAG: sugar ABC transporter substrate-binding protein [Anaerolineaceae bacterium]|nr:sugar ABC transporter substrate-binding protein [Anaerolineaceae bacterium]
MKTRWFIILSAFLVLSMVLSACAAGATTTPTTAAVEQPTSPPAPQPTTPPPTAEPTIPPTAMAPASTCLLPAESGAKISFSGWGDTTEQKIYRDSIDRFKAVCPDVSVDYVPIPDKFQDKMKAQMAGGTAPDVFYVDDQLMTAFAPSGQLLALDDPMKKAGVSTSDFIPSLMSEFTLSGKTYALPKDWGTLGLIYLPEAFTAAGIPEPTADWTWDDMRTAAKTLAAKAKMGGFCMNADWARFAPFVMSNGGDFATLDGKTAKLDTPEVKTMATLVADMFKEKSLVRASDVGASWCGEAIGKKLVAMTTEGGWMVNFMKTTYPDVKWKAIEIPKGPKTRADIIFTNGIGVNAATKYPNAAAALAIFLTGKDNQGAIVKTGFAYSTHPDQASLIQDPNDLAISQGGLLPDSHPAYWGPYTGKLEDIVSKALERVFLGDQTVDKSFTQAQQEATAALAGQ